jgi:homeobox protein cut-like
MKRMHIFERMILRVTKFVLQTRSSRNIFAAYLLGLHFMVFWMLFSTAGAHTGSAIGATASAAGPIDVGPGDLWHKDALDEATT